MKTLVIAAAIVLAALAGCNRNDAGATAPAASQLATTAAPVKSLDQIGTPIARFDPCALLEPKEIEAALGAPLAVPPYRTSEAQSGRAGAPDADGTSCYYVTGDFHSIHVGTAERGGSGVLTLMRKINGMVKTTSAKVVVLSKGTNIDGGWDDAELIGCCDFYAVLGEHGVNVDVGGSKASIAQAASLADAALHRFDKPLAIDGTAAAAPARSLMATRPQVGSACALASRAEVEAAVGPLSADPASSKDGRACEVHAAQGVFSWKIEDPSGGYAAMRSMLASLEKDAGAVTRRAESEGLNAQSMKIMGNLASGLTLRPVDNAAWDQGVVSMRGLYAVRKDVRVSCATTLSPQQVDVCTRLTAAVTGRL